MPRLKFVSKVEGANTIELQEPIITIGRGINNVICIEDANISKNHVLLILEDDAYRIFDLHSINGTSINGKRIGTARLQAGDAVRIGYLDLIYEAETPAPAKPVVPEPPATPVTATPAPPPPAPEPVAPVVAAPEPAAPVVAPPPAPAEPIAATPAKRSFFGFGKRAPAPTPTPAPVTAPAPVAPAAPEPAAPVAPPAPVQPAAPEPPAEVAASNQPAKKKFGAPPSGQNVKFRLKRE